MLKVVLDTNIIISALYLPNSKPAKVLEMARRGQIQNVISKYILAEIEEVLERKFLWEPDKIKKATSLLKSFSEMAASKEKICVLDYEPDNRILECAISGNASIIISGDKKHLLKLGHYKNTIIIDPSSFLGFFSK